MSIRHPGEHRTAKAVWAQCASSTPVDLTTIFPEDLGALLLKGQVDVLVTHEAPEIHPMGFPVLGDLARAMGVKMLIHGHHHERYSATLDGGIRVEGVGMSGLMLEWKKPEDGLFWLDPREV